MKVLLAIVVTILGFAVTTLARDNEAERKQQTVNPKGKQVKKTKRTPPNQVKWEGPDYDAAKNEEKGKQGTGKVKGKK